MKAIRDVLIEWRGDDTRTRIAVDAEVTEMSVRNWERGRAVPNLSTLLKLERAKPGLLRKIAKVFSV